MSPPLRSHRDVEEIKKGIRDSTIDIIATDHAPHDITSKEVEFSQACFGIVGLETALSLSLKLIEEKLITLPNLINKMTYKPAQIFNLDKGTLSPGKIADIVIFDPKERYTIDIAKLKSKSTNTPFNGWEVTGKIIHTLVGGKIVYSKI